MNTLTGLPELDFQIMLNLNYNELSYLCTVNKEYVKLCSNDYFWKQKYLIDFPNSNYFKSWSWKQNYYVKLTKTFTIVLNFYNQLDYVSPYLYTNSNLVNLILNDVRKSVIIDAGDIPVTMDITVDLNHHYVAIKKTPNDQKFEIIGYENNLEDLYELVYIDSENVDEFYYYTVAVIDLEKMMPYQHGINNNKNYVTFHKIQTDY